MEKKNIPPFVSNCSLGHSPGRSPFMKAVSVVKHTAFSVFSLQCTSMVAVWKQIKQQQVTNPGRKQKRNKGTESLPHSFLVHCRNEVAFVLEAESKQNLALETLPVSAIIFFSSLPVKVQGTLPESRRITSMMFRSDPKPETEKLTRATTVSESERRRRSILFQNLCSPSLQLSPQCFFSS